MSPGVTVHNSTAKISILVNLTYWGREREIRCLYHVTENSCLKICSQIEKTIGVQIRESQTLNFS